MRGHIDTETLAAYREGLLSRRRAARAAAHVSGCPRCAETGTQLAGVTTILASSPVPPMPAGLTARIEAALAAEAAGRAAEAGSTAAAGLAAATGDGGEAGDGGAARREPLPRHAGGGRAPAHGRRSGGGRRPGGRSWLTPRVAAAAAAVAIIAGGGYGLSQIYGESSPSASTGSGPGASRNVPASSGKGGSAAGSRIPTGMGAEAAGGLDVVRSGTGYQPQQLGSQAKTVLTRYGTPGNAPATPSAAPRPAPFAGFSDLSACVHRASGGRTPELVDLASYRGQRAAVIMIPAGQGRVRVLVVGTGCSASASDILARSMIGGTR